MLVFLVQQLKSPTESHSKNCKVCSLVNIFWDNIFSATATTFLRYFCFKFTYILQKFRKNNPCCKMFFSVIVRQSFSYQVRYTILFDIFDKNIHNCIECSGGKRPDLSKSSYSPVDCRIGCVWLWISPFHNKLDIYYHLNYLIKDS